MMGRLGFTNDLDPTVEPCDQSHACLVVLSHLARRHVWLHREQNTVGIQLRKVRRN
jgi:hypothetical protein